jgi:hypothetical protein
MPARGSRAALPIVIIGGAVVVAAGAVAVVERFLDSRRDHSAAPPGTPQVAARLPIALWPSDGSEPMVGHGLRGWRELAAVLYHRDTVIDDGARARAVVIAEHSRREQDARREVALEAHVLRGTYEPALIAAAWLNPLLGVHVDDLRAFGIGEDTLAAVDALSVLDADPDLAARWRRELGVDNIRPEVTQAIVDETAEAQRGMLWAVLLDLAAERLAVRQR